MTRIHGVALLLLAACSSPQERCIAETSRELRVMNGLVNQTRANVIRGYGIENVQEVISVRTTCTGQTEDGLEFEFDCERPETVTTRKPVALDLNAEKAKLASLEERQIQLQANQSAAAAQCRAQFPE